MTLHPFDGILPTIAPDAFIAPGVQVIGHVRIGAQASIWFNCVLRGDVMPIEIGRGSNIQDGSIVHVTTGTRPTIVGNDCLIGHLAIIHGCTLEDHAFVGMGGIIMDGCVIESDAMLAAGALLTPGKRIPTGDLWGGRPAAPMRRLTTAEIDRNRAAAAGYVELAKRYRQAP
ncbi:gamma carbonic anhydrase family protein [Sphingosinicellaceae bacterium]|nr:gamma carbonic anhydrase family protein [Sphingosinicellaceae bacterium]